jgi:hypothetical protein
MVHDSVYYRRTLYVFQNVTESTANTISRGTRVRL